MNEQEDKSLRLVNTPLENLRTMLSEADASAQIVEPKPASVPKSEIRKVIERLAAEKTQFLSPQAIRQAVQSLMPRERAPLASRNIFENQSVAQLDRLLKRSE